MVDWLKTIDSTDSRKKSQVKRPTRAETLPSARPLKQEQTEPVGRAASIRDHFP